MIALDDATLVAPGGVYVSSERTLVVADTHTGYVQTLQRRGYTLPAQDDGVLHARIQLMLVRCDVERVVVAGDLLHGRAAMVARNGQCSPFEAFVRALDGRQLVVVAGNHDRASSDLLTKRGVEVCDSYAIAAHRVMHGDEGSERLCAERTLAIVRGGRLMLGHHHPALTLDDGAGTRRRVAAFVYAPGLVCLPALAPLARGCDLYREDYGQELAAIAKPTEIHVAVVVGNEVMNVGILSRIRATRSERDVR
jgi:uncharacterized protein